MATDPKDPKAPTDNPPDEAAPYELTAHDVVKVATELGCRLKTDFTDEPDPASREVVVVTDTNREIRFPVSAIKARTQDEALRQVKAKIQKG